MAEDIKIVKTDCNVCDGNFRENYLGFQLAFVSHNFHEEFNNYLKKQGMPWPKWRVLVNIKERPGIRVTSLAKNTLFEQSRVTKLVDQLCEEGLVVKVNDVKDRRQVLLNLTPEGRQTVIPFILKAKEHESVLLSSLDKADAKKLKNILAKLAQPYLAQLKV